MTNEVWETSLNAYPIGRPFKPLQVGLESGSPLTVKHPEAIVMFGGAAVFIDVDLSITVFDADGMAKLSDRVARRASA